MNVERIQMSNINTLNTNNNAQLDNGLLLNNIERGTISRFKTYCCALGQLSLSNDHSLEFIKNAVEFLKEENETPAHSHERNGHERAYFVMTLPEEEKLEENLAKVGFIHLTTIHRRNYAPEDSMLKMWMISW
jgi:hypothetical protein